MSGLNNFFYMHGYGVYVWSAYTVVCAFLFLQWLIPFRRWQKYSREHE